MSDNSTRWQRVVSQAGEKPRFRARQTTDDLPPPPKRSRSRSNEPLDQAERATRWWIISVLGLTALAAMLTWLVFFA